MRRKSRRSRWRARASLRTSCRTQPIQAPEIGLAAADYRWQAYGENVALGQSSAEKALDGWMHSRGHRANILTPDFTEMGAGYAIDRARRLYYVQVFARPPS